MEKVKIHRATVRLKNIAIFYRDTKAKGPAILCLHGRYGRGENWVDFIRRYGNRYRVIAPDQRGHGLSGKPATRYSAEEMAADMVGLLKFLRVDQAIVVGHSMGGRVAGYLTASQPRLVKALAILDKSSSAPAKAQTPASDPLTKDWPMPFATYSDAREFIRQAMDSDLGYHYFMDSLVETAEGYRMMFSTRAMAANIANEEDWFHLLPKITCPVLMVRSRGSGAVSDEDFDRMRSLLPDCTAREIPHPDHNVHLGNKEMFYDCFDFWVRNLGRTMKI